MKYFRILLLLSLVFPLLSATPVHKFYVSITKMEYVKEKNSIQIITKIFTDDIENALRKKHGPAIWLGTKKETEAVAKDVKNYLLQNIKIKVNDKPVQLDYIGKEYDIDMLVAYFEITGITKMGNIEIENKVLMELFPEQQNIVHLKTVNSRRSLILDKDEPRDVLNFN